MSSAPEVTLDKSGPLDAKGPSDANGPSGANGPSDVSGPIEVSGSSDVDKAHDGRGGASDFHGAVDVDPARPEALKMEREGSGLPQEGTLLSRISWFLLGATPLIVLITAATLTPSAEGHGTHTQLGLPPCGFLASTGLPCPGCGLTTSFAHMMRFEWAGAASANAFGVALFLVSAFTIPISFFAMFRGLPVMATMERLQFEKVVVLLAVCSTVVWSIRILTILF